MSKLQELIQRLCPDGVEYKKLGEVLEYEQPTKYIVKSTEYDDSYSIPVLTAGQSFILGYTNEQKGVFDASKDNPVIIFDDFTTSFHWVDFPFKIKSSAMKMLRPKDDSINFKYIHYAMQCIGFVPGEHTRYWISKYSMFTIPVPPLEVQEEIVRILDRFSDYAAELQAELQARKEQYEYYRNLLLTFNPAGCAGEADDEQEGSVTTWGGHSYPIQWKTMGEIFEMRNGYTPSKSNNSFWDNGTIPWFRMEDIRENGRILSDAIQHITPEAVKGKGLFEANTFILATTATIGEHALIIADSLANQQFTNLKVRKSLSNSFLTKYLYYYMFIVDEFCKNNTNVSGFASVDMGKLKRMSIPIPPLELQEKIVAILDRFETLVNDLSEGLPAEIAAVKEQYEYYRNRLLTFKEKTA